MMGAISWPVVANYKRKQICVISHHHLEFSCLLSLSSLEGQTGFIKNMYVQKKLLLVNIWLVFLNQDNKENHTAN